jgi:phosphatidylglycerol:prolipoprotein diacylglycerol transferase
VPFAVIELNFDPYLRIGGQAVRWETLALAAVILVVLSLAALGARRQPAGAGAGGWQSLRRDDLLFIVLGIVPGAVVGGRLTYVLVHLDFYQANAALIVDPASGGLALTGAVLFGTLTGMYVARLLAEPIGRWLDLGAVALVIGLGLGKLAEVLGGSGQGAIASTSWATAYVGPGPWGVLGPELPAHPAQVYEALGDALVLAGILVLGRIGPFQRGDGRRFLAALGGWAIVRFIVAFSWRDAPVAGPLRTEQLLDIGLLLIGIVGLAVIVRRPATIVGTTPSDASPAAPTGMSRPPGPREDSP